MPNVLHFKAEPAREGLVEVLSPRNSASEGLELSLLKLAPGQFQAGASEGLESVLVVMSGRCDIEAGGNRWEGVGGRRHVFDGRAATVFLPAGCEFRAGSEGGAEVAVIRAPAPPGGEPYLIGPDEVEVVERGTGSHRREVHTILDSKRSAGALIVGETFNRPGAWSSYPPHKHDVDDLPRQARLQEVYHFRLDPSQGFGIQRVYSPERGFDMAYVVEDRDSVLIPYGYHPVVAGAGYRLYYLWALAGQGRTLAMVEDPDHEWLGNRS